MGSLVAVELMFTAVNSPSLIRILRFDAPLEAPHLFSRILLPPIMKFRDNTLSLIREPKSEAVVNVRQVQADGTIRPFRGSGRLAVNGQRHCFVNMWSFTFLADLPFDMF